MRMRVYSRACGNLRVRVRNRARELGCVYTSAHAYSWADTRVALVARGDDLTWARAGERWERASAGVGVHWRVSIRARMHVRAGVGERANARLNVRQVKLAIMKRDQPGCNKKHVLERVRAARA